MLSDSKEKQYGYGQRRRLTPKMRSMLTGWRISFCSSMLLRERNGLQSCVYSLDSNGSVQKQSSKKKSSSVTSNSSRGTLSFVKVAILYCQAAFASVFLPVGYPDSVSKDYLIYQVWDTLQALCSSVTGLLSTQAILQYV